MPTVIEEPARRPVASIIIVAWRQLDLLLACLRSLADTITGDVAAEIIVVSNDAPQAVKDGVRRAAPGVRLIEAAANLGFGGGCTLGAQHARGEFLVFLNDDTRVAPRWLEWLVRTAREHPHAGAVGSLILFPDGTVQEAGSVIWADGSTMPVGRHASAASLQLQFVRQVDFVSACSLLVRRAAWECAGGFDPAYHPAYYEDVDLCLAMREAGWTVLFEPRSRVWHHESASTDDRFKRFLFGRNQQRLRLKWPRQLAQKEGAAPESPAALAAALRRAQGSPTRVLVVDDRVPDPSMGSGYGRQHDALLALASAGYGVSLYPVLGGVTVPDALVSAGIAIIDEPLETHLAMSWHRYDVAVVSRPHNFERAASCIRTLQPGARLVYDCEALFWRRLARQADLESDAGQRTLLQGDANRMRRLEQRIVQQADLAVTVSEEEADLLRDVAGCCAIQPLLPSEPAVTFGEGDFHRRQGIGYVAGWMAGTTSPNADGLRWFVREVLPLVRQDVPWVRVDVTGALPPDDLLALADANLRFVGHVDDIAAFYADHRVIVVPIRFGAGVKVKTVQAVQYGVPVVSTSCGAEGLAFNGSGAAAIADEADGFARATVRLLTEAAAWQAARTSMRTVLAGWAAPVTGGSWPEVVARALAEKPYDNDALPARR